MHRIASDHMHRIASVCNPTDLFCTNKNSIGTYAPRGTGSHTRTHTLMQQRIEMCERACEAGGPGVLRSDPSHARRACTAARPPARTAAWRRFGTASVGPAADRYIARSDGTAGMAVAREWDQRLEAADLDCKTPVNLHLSQHRLHLQLRQSPAASTTLNGREAVQSHMRMEIELVKRHGMRRAHDAHLLFHSTSLFPHVFMMYL